LKPNGFSQGRFRHLLFVSHAGTYTNHDYHETILRIFNCADGKTPSYIEQVIEYQVLNGSCQDIDGDSSTPSCRGGTHVS
jgi:hypothetical protein